MKTIGLLGGMSWESSIEYERIINTEVRRRLGGVHSADLLIRSYNFDDIEALQLEGEWDRAGALLATDAARLEAAGADLIVLATNTMHKVAPQIESAITIPFLHIADATADAVHRGRHRFGGAARDALHHGAGLLSGSPGRSGLTVMVPGRGRPRSLIHDVIFGELVQGRVEAASKQRFLEIIDGLYEQGAEGVVAGCTEIELLVTPDDLDRPYFPTTRIHAIAAVDAALA